MLLAELLCFSLGTSTYQLGQAADLAAGSRFVDNTLGRSLIDVRDGLFQGALGGIEIALSNGSANLLDEAAHG